MRKKSVYLRFFMPCCGDARFGKQGKCGHTCYFCKAGALAKMLVGELPKPAGLLDTLSRSPIVCGPLLSLLGLIFPPVRVAEQVIHVCLDCHGLPHIRLGVAVFSIEGFFLFRELPAFLFQRVHLWELRPV